tara:strand:+ start:563 stop:4246 length:3684 start_codon:yes stop_codon:yes gene_type:complete
MVAKVSDPYPVFYDLEGDPLEAGYIYIGEYELDPVGNPKPAYWDVALTVPAAQPVRTLAGRPINEGSQIGVLYVSGEYSILVQDNLEQLVVSDDVETCKTFAERAEAAAAAALAGNVYLTRTEAEATVIPIEANLIWVFHDDVPCLFQRSETEVALTTLGSVTWKAAEGKDSYLQHWGVSTYDTRELARTAVTSMTTIERTAHQAAVERAYLDAEGTLMLNGWVEVLDEIIVGQRCVPDVIDGIAGESLSCGLFFTSRFNMTADSCYTAGATGSGSYAPYIKGLSIALDISEAETAGQLAYSVVVAPATVERIAAYDAAIASGSTVSEAEAAGQLAYDNYLTANPLVLPAAIAASNVDFGVALPNYPPAFVGKEAFGVLETARITGMCRDSSTKWIAPTFGATNDDNVGGWEIKNLQLSGVDQDLRIENGFHFLKLGRVDDWVWDLGPRAQDYRNRDVTAGVKREAMYFGRLDSLIADHVGMFEGGQIVYDKGEGNSITDQFGTIQLDGDGASLTLRSGRSQIGMLYGTEDVALPALSNKILCEAGTHDILGGSLIGDSLAMIKVTGGRVVYGGILRDTNTQGHGGLVTGGQLIFDGTHFVVGVEGGDNPFSYANWQVGYLQQSGTGELAVKANCTAEAFLSGSVQGGSTLEAWQFTKVLSNNTGCNIEPSPRTRAEMVLALSGVAYCLHPIKGSRVYSLDGLSYLGNATATAIPDLLGLIPNGPITPYYWQANAAPGTTDMTPAIVLALDYANSLGGGVVGLHAGDHLVTDQSVAPANFDDRVAIHILHSNVSLSGDSGSKITLADAQDAHTIKIGARAGSVVGEVIPSHVTVEGIEVNGNWTNQTPTTDSDFHGAGLDVAEKTSNIKLQNLYIHHTQYYGIGFQRDGVFNCRVLNVRIEDTGADGIDCKNDDGLGYGNEIDGVSVKRHGLAPALTLPQSGIDIRSGWTCKNFAVSDWGTVNGLVGVRYLVNVDSGFNAVAGSGYHFGYVNPSTSTGTQGARIDAPKFSMTNVDFVGCGQAARITSREGHFFGVNALDGVTGFTFAEGANGTDADQVTLTSCMARGNTGVGFDLEANVVRCEFIGCDSRANGTGLKTAAGVDGTLWVGGSITGNATALTDSGGNTIIQNTNGFRTGSRVTGSVAVDSTGVKSLTIAHNLAVTPDINDIQLTIARDTAVNDYAFDNLGMVNAVNSTNIFTQTVVGTASATGGATATLVATINSKAYG